MGSSATLFAGDYTRSRLTVTCIGSMSVKKGAHICLLLIRDLNDDTLTRAAFDLCAVDHKREGGPREASGFASNVAF